MRTWLLAALGLLAPALSSAQPAPRPPTPRPIVGELFTSQGCSSCPPADALITSLAHARPDLLLLTFHVTYWNYLGWHDPYSLDAATARQKQYVALGISPEVYTPALIIDGRLNAIGSDSTAVTAAFHQAAATSQTAAQITLERRGPTLDITVSPGSGQAKLLLIGYDSQHQTHIGIGENGGRTLAETNIVRSVTTIASWTGQPLHLNLPPPPGEQFAALLQQPDGSIIGAARLQTIPPGT